MSTDSTPGSLRHEIEELVVLATGRAISVQELRDCDGSLEAVGVNSLAFLNLIEVLETRYGVAVDADTDPARLVSVDSLVGLVSAGAE
ncbi:phosphopantetheine-binding protein [Streptomyces sp. NPDC026589]|uniref:phosphopantetheine-binding protein n=1 Tax=Streptomyces sp. NPDC026589 TaxID=3155609 RepID=UPI0033C64DC5